jgi:hypothetical protein
MLIRRESRTTPTADSNAGSPRRLFIDACDSYLTFLSKGEWLSVGCQLDTAGTNVSHLSGIVLRLTASLYQLLPLVRIRSVCPQPLKPSKPNFMPS